MWGHKKLDTPQSAARARESLITKMKNADAMSPSEPTRDPESAWLGSNLRVKGDISGTEDLLIDGSVEGRIELGEQKLTVGAAAKLTADINAREVVVCGYVKGNIHATRKIEIKKSGSVHGDLTTARILIEDGAEFKGSIEIDRANEGETDKNISSRTAAHQA
jgi:cytoskeletal protein CcmA (bactofilin family)